jgi:hypothetical protein
MNITGSRRGSLEGVRLSVAINTGQNKQKLADVHAFSGIRTNFPILERAQKRRALDRAVIALGWICSLFIISRLIFAIGFPWRRNQNVMKYD